MKWKISGLIGMFVFTLNCSLAPKFIKPETPMPDQWPKGDAYQTNVDSSTVLEMNRQEFFADENLLKVIEMALDNNRDLRLATLNVERVGALYDIQKNEVFPKVYAEGGGGKTRQSVDLIPFGDPRTREQYSINMGIASWELDIFGRIRSLKDQALEAYLATDEVRHGFQISLMAGVAKTYLALAADHENLQLARVTLENQQESHKLVQKLFDSGLATNLDLSRSKIPVEVARGSVARFLQKVAQHRNALDLLVGLSVPDELLPSNLSSVTPPAPLSPGLSSEILLRRPDIMAAEHRLKGAYAFIGVARASLFPRISLTSSIGTASDSLSGLFTSGTNTWNFGPRLTIPVFDSRAWAALRVSKTDQKIIQTQYEKVIQIAFREVADALSVQGTIDLQISAQESLVKAVARTYHISEERYKKGVDGYLSVLEAQRSLFEARQNLIMLRLAKFVNRIQLFTVIGGDTRKTGSRIAFGKGQAMDDARNNEKTIKAEKREK